MRLPKSSRRRLLSITLAASFTGSLPSIALAVDKAATGTELTAGASWDGGDAPVTTGANNPLITSSGGARWLATSSTGAHTVNSPVTWDLLDFANTTDLSISGSPITLAGANLGNNTYNVINTSGAGAITIANDLILTGVHSASPINVGNVSSRIQFIATGGTLTLGNVTANGDNVVVNDINLTIRGTGTGVINGTLNIDGQVFKGDPGTWILNGNNTMGWFAINNGVTLAGNDGAFGTGTIYSLGGRIASADATARTFTNVLDVGATTTLGQTVGGTGALTFTNSVLLGSVSRAINVDANTTFSGPITSTASGTAFTKGGSANLTLTGDLSGISGAVAVSAGTLILNPSTPHTGGITLNGGGTLALVDNTAHGTGNLVTFNGGTITSSDATPRTIGNDFIYTNASIFGQTSGGTGELTLTGNVDLGGSARTFTTNVNTTVTGNVTNVGTGSLTKAGTADLTLAGSANVVPTITVNAGTAFVTGNITIAGDFTKSGAGHLALTGDQSGIGGAIIVTAGTLTVDPSALHVGGYTLTGGALTLADNTAHGVGKTLTFNGGGIASTDATPRTIGNALAFTGNAVFGQTTDGTGALTLTTNSVDLEDTARTFTANVETTFTGNIIATAGLTKAGTADLILAGSANAIPTMTVNTGAVLVTGNITSSDFTKSGAGHLALTGDQSGISGAIIVTAGTLTVDPSALHAGGYTLTGGALTLADNTAHGVGKTLTFNGGGIASTDATPRTIDNPLAFTGNAVFGQTTGGTGELTLTSNAALGGVTRTFTVNAETTFTGNVTNTSGGLTKAGTGNLILAGSANSLPGTITVNAGTLTLATANNFPGNFDLNGGILAAGADGAFGTATIRLDSGTIASSDSTPRTITTTKTIDFALGSGFGTATTGNLTFTDNVNLGSAQKTATVNNAITEFSGTISSGTTTNSFAKAGPGILILSGNSTYNRPTVVSAGTLLVNGSITGTTNAMATVNGGTLGGTGTIDVPVTVNGGGALAPGASIESLGVASLSMVGGSAFVWEAADASSTGADLLTVTGALSLADVTLSLDAATQNALASNAWNINDKLTLINYGGTAVTSGFTGYTDDTEYTFGLNNWLINYNDTTGGLNYAGDATAGNFLTLTYVSAIPEPGTVALGVLAAVIGPALYLRRRRLEK